MSYGAIAKKVVDSGNGLIEENFNKEVATIVKQHSAACTAAAVAAMCPYAGPTICMVAQTALIYTMYIRMNRAMGITLSKNVVKALASAVISNLVSNVGGCLLSIVGATALSFIPVVGNYASALMMFGVSYATVMIAAKCYSKTLLALSKKGKKVENMSEEEIKEVLKQEMDSSDLKGDMKAYTKAYKQGRKDGTFTGKETVTMEEWDADEDASDTINEDAFEDTSEIIVEDA